MEKQNEYLRFLQIRMLQIWKKTCLLVLFAIFDSWSVCACCSNISDVIDIHSSLDSIKIQMPSYNSYKCEVVLNVTNQTQWNHVCHSIEDYLQKGYRNIKISVEANRLELEKSANVLKNLDYPDANIQIVSKNTLMVPSGFLFSSNSKNRKTDSTSNKFYYSDFDINDIILDGKNIELSLYESVFTIDSEIESVESDGETEVLNPDGTLYKKIIKTWRFKTALPDLNEEDCKDFYILLTRLWTSCRHKVVRVKDGWIYFHLKSDDAPTLMQQTLDPNSDKKIYKVSPRCRLVNSPVSRDIHFKNDCIYIPKVVKQVRIGKGGKLFAVSNCHFNSFTISGFHIIGAGNVPCISVQSSKFSDQLWIKSNQFSNLSANAIVVAESENVSVYDNVVENTRRNAIYCSGKNISIWQNKLKNIGYMLQTMAISFSGENIHVFENNIEDFNYSAIATGSAKPNNQHSLLTYVIERNHIRYSTDFTNTSKDRTLADGGGIYVGPQNTQGIIRYNVIENLTGAGANRGIFLDDGVKNLAVYGNLIMQTANSYDIDLRFCKTYAKDIPDHNTNNIIFHNIMTGGYRFQDTDSVKSLCFGGQNLLLGIGNFQKCIIKLQQSTPDIRVANGVYKNGKIVIPKHNAYLLDDIKADSYIRKYIYAQNNN